MPSRDRVRKKAEKGPRSAKRGSAKSLRKLNFQNEPWYAEAARRLSAVRRTSDDGVGSGRRAPAGIRVGPQIGSGPTRPDFDVPKPVISQVWHAFSACSGSPQFVCIVAGLIQRLRNSLC